MTYNNNCIVANRNYIFSWNIYVRDIFAQLLIRIATFIIKLNKILSYYLHEILWFWDISSEIFWIWIFICDIFSPYRIDVVYYICYMHTVKLSFQLAISAITFTDHFESIKS